jgi:hypothetical protein
MGAKLRAVWDGSSSRRDRRIQKPRVLTLGTVPPLRRALKGRQIECVNSTHLTKSALSPLQGESPYLMVPWAKLFSPFGAGPLGHRGTPKFFRRPCSKFFRYRPLAGLRSQTSLNRYKSTKRKPRALHRPDPERSHRAFSRFLQPVRFP